MLEISTSGLMSEGGKRSGLFRAQPPRPSSTLPIGCRFGQGLDPNVSYFALQLGQWNSAGWRAH